MREAWGPGKLAGVIATVENLAKYLRIVDTNLSIVLSAGAADVKIGDLKIHSNMSAIMEALSVATDGNIRGGPAANRNAWFIMGGRRTIVSQRTVEVFNLTGYIRTLGDAKEDVVRAKLDEVQRLTAETLATLYEGRNVENPSFRFHAGTSLLIVTGNSDYIEVVRKIVNALPGQQKSSHEDLLDINVPPTQK